MRNMSKKTRKKVIHIIKANCHSKDERVWIPFDSSRMSAIWTSVCIGKFKNRYIIFGMLKDSRPFHFFRRVYINYPEQLTNPRAPIEINKQIVQRWEEGGFV